ncbi:hypothetical protein CBL_05451 [Carabus blaptoides fortunei]
MPLWCAPRLWIYGGGVTLPDAIIRLGIDRLGNGIVVGGGGNGGVCDTTAVRSLQITTRYVFEGMSGLSENTKCHWLITQSSGVRGWGAAEQYFVIRGVTKQKYSHHALYRRACYTNRLRVTFAVWSNHENHKTRTHTAATDRQFIALAA